ncbi:unnamed protein product [Prunus armeniaca]|uniref:Uncharacterized protein n=1 Tax=Prunus armeniaca TaxID=36596 RepID=A0A6J5UBQ2_PRUAR|nr:unnamed protein product [Prunus armeniaca]
MGQEGKKEEWTDQEGKRGGVDSGDGFMVSVINAEVVGDEGNRGDGKGFWEWENDERMVSVGAGRKVRLCRIRWRWAGERVD